MHDVETYMGEIGKRCNTRMIDKKCSNLQMWTEEVGAPSTKSRKIPQNSGDDTYDFYGRGYTLLPCVTTSRPP